MCVCLFPYYYVKSYKSFQQKIKSKGRWNNKNLFSPHPFKLKRVKHGHDATAGNEQVTKLLHLYTSKRQSPCSQRYTPLISLMSPQRKRMTDENGKRSYKNKENHHPAKVVSFIFNPTFELPTGGRVGFTRRETLLI